MEAEVGDAGSHPAKPTFKVAANQVAGHRFEGKSCSYYESQVRPFVNKVREVTSGLTTLRCFGHSRDEEVEDGRVGSLVDDSGRFYKPLQDGSRGDKEVTFYEKIWSDTKVPPSIQSFFPKFYGTVNIDAPDGSGSNRHAIMEDLTHGFQHPCIIDVKMGARTWYPEAGEKYVEKCMKKDKETTSEALGFRLSGMQVYEAKMGTVWKGSRKWCKYMKPEDVPEALKRYVSSNSSEETGADGAYAREIYSGPHGVLAQLQELQAWFEKQTFYHFFSASVLLVYEGEPSAHRTVSVRLVDFAHVLYNQNTRDENFLAALKALMHMLSDIVESCSKGSA